MEQLPNGLSPHEQEAFGQISRQPEVQDLHGLYEILETPTPWDEAVLVEGNPANHSFTVAEASRAAAAVDELAKKFSIATGEGFRNDGFGTAVYDVLGSALYKDNWTDQRQKGYIKTGPAALKVVALYPNPADLIGQIQKREAELGQGELTTMQQADAALLADLQATRGWDRHKEDQFRQSLHGHYDANSRHRHYEEMLQTLYGERYDMYKQMHADNAFATNSGEDMLEFKHVPAAIHELGTEEIVAIMPDQAALLDVDVMQAKFGIDGRLVGVLNIGSDNKSLSIGIIDIRGAGDAINLENGRQVSNPFLNQPAKHVEGSYLLAAMHDDGSFGNMIGINPNQIYDIGRSTGTLKQLFRHQIPTSVSRSHCSIALTGGLKGRGDLIIRNNKPTNRSILEKAIASSRSIAGMA